MSARQLLRPPGAAFALTFRRLVLPTLAAECRCHGVRVALNLVGFGDAHRSILHQGIRRGALCLQPDVFADLEEWVCISLLEAAVSCQPAIAEAQAVADRVMVQLRRHYAVWGQPT